MENTPSDIVLLPLWSIYELDDEYERVAVRVIRLPSVACDNAGPEECDRSGIHYSGWTCDGGPSGEILCPRHWYMKHTPCDSHHRFEDMTDDEYGEQLLAFAANRLTRVREVEDQVNVLARQLGLLGFQQEANTLYQATGAIDVIARRKPRP